MNNAAVYLMVRLFDALWSVLRHWYGDGFVAIIAWVVNTLEGLDQRLALRVTVRYFFKPLYQDYTAVGYVFGFIFRSIRILLAILVYAVVVGLAAAAYTIWAFLPPYIIYTGLPPAWR